MKVGVNEACGVGGHYGVPVRPLPLGCAVGAAGHALLSMLVSPLRLGCAVDATGHAVGSFSMEI